MTPRSLKRERVYVLMFKSYIGLEWKDRIVIFLYLAAFGLGLSLFIQQTRIGDTLCTVSANHGVPVCWWATQKPDTVGFGIRRAGMKDRWDTLLTAISEIKTDIKSVKSQQDMTNKNLVWVANVIHYLPGADKAINQVRRDSAADFKRAHPFVNNPTVMIHDSVWAYILLAHDEPDCTRTIGSGRVAIWRNPNFRRGKI